MSVGKSCNFMVLLIFNGRAKTKGAILAFLYCKWFVKITNLGG